MATLLGEHLGSGTCSGGFVCVLSRYLSPVHRVMAVGEAKKNKERVFVGTDAKVMQALKRFAPATAVAMTGTATHRASQRAKKG